MSVKIVVLDDGDSWAGNASILELTDEAYERLIDGAARIKDLDGPAPRGT